MQKSDLAPMGWTILLVALMLVMIIQPHIVLQGALKGLKLWLEIILPALLPFFIVADLLIKLGFVQFIGTLLEPLMRPLFNVPGEGGFALALGITCGAPLNAVVTAELRKEGLCTKDEAQRLICFTSNCSLLFMLSAVAVGMFGHPRLGLVIAGSHIIANLLIGVGLAFLTGKREPKRYGRVRYSCKKALRAMLHEQRIHREPFATLLGNAVSCSVQKLLVIGGFVMFLGVILQVLTNSGVINAASVGLESILTPLPLCSDVFPGIVSGFFETTLATQMISETGGTELSKLIAIAIILGWSGISVQAQVASMVSGTDIRIGMFLISRVLHGLLAAILTPLLYNPIITTGSTQVSMPAPSLGLLTLGSLALLPLTLFLLVLLSQGIHLIQKTASTN